MDKIIVDVLEIVVGLATTYFFGSTGFHFSNNSKSKKVERDLIIAYKLASGVVATLSQRGDLPNAKKFELALQKVLEKLNAKGIHISEDTLKDKINQAYQDYKASGGDIHKFGSELIEQSMEDIQQEMVTPEGRMIQSK